MKKTYKIKSLFDLNKAFEELKAITDYSKSKTLTFEDNAPLRSLSQNAYLHVCISIFAIETGWTLSEAKDLLKDLCDFAHYEKNGHYFLKETSKMNSKELTDFIEWIRNYAGMNGINIPDAETYKIYHTYFDQIIAENKEFL